MNLKDIVNGKVQTRSGDKVRIYEVLSDENKSCARDVIHGAVYYGGQWHIMAWREGGASMLDMDSCHDLVLIKPPSRWINVYEPSHRSYGLNYSHSSREDADRNQDRSGTRTRIACIEFREGDGV